MTDSLDAPSKIGFVLVRFFHGDPADFDVESYTNSQSTESGYVSVPSMELDIPEMTGVLKEKPAKITLKEDAFLKSISEGLPVGPVFCQIVERHRNFDTPGVAGSEQTLFTGKITRTTRNYKGRPGSVRVEVSSWKSILSHPINPGVVETHCNWPFNEGGCALGFGSTTLTRTAVIDAVDGKMITSTDSILVGMPGRWWSHGSVTLGRVSIDIRDWSSANPTQFFMTRQVPASWVGASFVQFHAGCSKTYSECEFFENELNFMGPGYATPDYLPVMETGSDG